MPIGRICVFCGASPGRDPAHLELATAVGTGLAERGIGVVYGGSRVGMMGALADAALAAGGEVIGVIPRRLVDRELAHTGLTELRVVETLHERKAEMAALSDGFIALPGGLGTLEELAEVASWAQLGLHAKPIGLLGPGGYWDALLAWLDHAVAEGFLARDSRALVTLDPDLATLLQRFGWQAPLLGARGRRRLRRLGRLRRRPGDRRGTGGREESRGDLLDPGEVRDLR